MTVHSKSVSLVSGKKINKKEIIENECLVTLFPESGVGQALIYFNFCYDTKLKSTEETVQNYP